MPATDDRRAWLRDAMRLIWYQLESSGGVPLVLSVVALDHDPDGNGDRDTELISMTCSVRAPGRVYALPVEREDGRRTAPRTGQEQP